MMGSQGNIFAYAVPQHDSTEKWRRILQGEEPFPEELNKILLRISLPFTQEDLIYAECSATLTALEGAYARQQRRKEEERLRATAHLVRGDAHHKVNNLSVLLDFIFNHRNRQVNTYGAFS
ncbi:hypothetical protein D2Q93_14320 [Alicyclobacillaceae bacterium I2511]|nr:hypothetical protein D2Q93_14320 [Alicyclobacillaceae bacterium I2511]